MGQAFSDWLAERSAFDARYGQLTAVANADPDWPHGGYATVRRRLVALGAGDLLPELAAAWVNFYPAYEAQTRRAYDHHAR